MPRVRQNAATIACQSCGAASTERQDPVSQDAIAYTCSCCLILGVGDATSKRRLLTAPGGASEGTDSGSPKTVPADPFDSRTSGTINRYRAVRSGRANKPGRPRVSEAQKRQQTRDRVRAFRARRLRGIGGVAG